MDSRRQLQIGSVIQEAFTSILTRDGKGIYGNAFVTVTKVKVTPDLSLARFYLSVYNSQVSDEVIEKVNAHKFELKRKLAEQLRHQLRVMPEIEFFKDESLEYAFHMDEVFKRLKEEEDSRKAELETAKSAPKPKTRKTSTQTKKAAKRKKK